MEGLLATPRGWIESFGEMVKFISQVVGEVFRLRVFRFFGEALRQSGILIISSTLVIWGLVFIIGLECGVEGAYFDRANGVPAYAGVFAAWCDLRELVPYGFGYMMSAKIGTGIVAELGSMRISDEIDALEVMGISGMTFLCATRLLAAWLVLPFLYICSIGAGFFASYLVVVQQIGDVSSGGFFLIFWQFQNPPDLLFSLIKAMAMATVIVLVGCYYGYNASGGPVGVGTATAKSMVVNIVSVHLIGMLGTQLFWGQTPEHQSEADMESGRENPETDEPAPLHDEPEHESDGAQATEHDAAPTAEASVPEGPHDGNGDQPTVVPEAEQGGSRVSVVDEQPPRPAPPKGATEEEYQWHTYKVYPSGRPDAVEFIDTYKAFGRARILRGLNMGLPEGMVSMILGPSGTGKSVCIKHMVGLLYPDQGDILVHGESVPNMPDDDLFEMRKKFGLLFQDGALFGSMNLFDNVAFPLRQHTEKSEEEIGDIVNRRLNEVGLGDAHDKMPNELSGGMRKRAGFARALVLEPDIVLFDEPDSGLDPVRTALLGELILEIHRDMMEEAKAKQKQHLPTFAVITHDIMSARRVADYINVLWRGRIVEAGPAEDMLNSDNPFIRQFLAGESQGPLTMD